MRWRAFALAAVLALGALPSFAQVALRVATWNVLAVGTPGTAEYNAALKILRRLDADVVAINEVSGNADINNLERLRQDLGFSHAVVAQASPFGAPLVAFLSHYQLSQTITWTSPVLSGDPAANDLTRNILEVRVDDARLGVPVSLMTTHWKSGTANSDEFRRAIESRRMGALAGQRVGEGLPVILMGDVNADIGDGAMTPATFTALPTGLPTSFSTGSDIVAVMNSGGLANDPFGPITAHTAIVEARQRDGSDATRPASGRRIDYLFAGTTIRIVASEVFDCVDDAALLPGTMVFVGSPVAASDCSTASDHLPVVADVELPGGPTPVTLSVTRDGSGAGTVASQPAGIACGTACSAEYPAGTSVTLSAAAASGSAFAGWGGACAGTTANVCTVSLTASTSVSATFVAVPAVVEFTSTTASVREGATSVILTVRRSSTAGATSVGFATRNGTATAGSDYTARSGSLSFAAGAATATLTITILDDSIVESAESFFVDLTNVTGGTLGAQATATVTIQDNDSRVEFESTAVSASEGAGTVTVWVRRVGDTSGTASVAFATGNGTARAKNDYIARSGTLSWAAGDTASKPITLTLVNDNTKEAAETFVVNLSSPTGTFLGTAARATVTIVDND